MKHIVSFSGGKDSTAMLLMMVARGLQIDEIVFCDTGMEFTAMYDHIKKVEKYIKMDITILKPKHSFKYYLGSHVKKNGGVGYGFPDFKNRWCTTLLKQDIFKKHTGKCIEYHGIAYDEMKRVKEGIKYPLIWWLVTEAEALEYCYAHGFKWDGLYEKFARVSCWCCPLQSIRELRVLYVDYPELWKELRTLDKLSYRQFRADYSVQELENRFEKEKLDKKNGMFPDMVDNYDANSR